MPQRVDVSGMDQDAQRLYDEGNRARLSGDYETARACLEQATAGCPTAACCWWALGHVLLNTGDFELSIAQFERAIQLEPDNAHYILDLAKSLEMLGEFDQARPYLERTIALAPSSREAEEARKSLSYY